MNILPLDEVLEKSDIILILVAHKEFKDIKKTQYSEMIFLDFCGALD